MQQQYKQFDVRRAGYQDDLRDDRGNELSAARQEAMNAMINLILKHKAEITKVPQCTTEAGAREWVAKRPNSKYRVAVKDIGGGPEEEVVIYDKAGRPFIVNGYKTKPSDYAIRKKYWEHNPTKEKRAANPMREWARDQVWSVKESSTNKWNRKVKATPQYEQWKKLGYRLPVKPKVKISPYSIFSTLIAPYVKECFDRVEPTQDEMDKNSPTVIQRIVDSLGGDGVPGPHIGKFILKIISPIAFYRYLYMRLVEQKFFFQLVAERAIEPDYKEYKKYMKDHKDKLRLWFMNNIMAGERKENFNPVWINYEVVKDALVHESIQWDGTDILDGIVHLIGKANRDDATKYGIGLADTVTIDELFRNDTFAERLLKSLSNKNDKYHKVNKRLLEIIKGRAQKSINSYLKSDRILTKFFVNEDAFNTFVQAVQVGAPNAPSEEAAGRQIEAAMEEGAQEDDTIVMPIRSPTKSEAAEADEFDGSDDEPEEDDDGELPDDDDGDYAA